MCLTKGSANISLFWSLSVALLFTEFAVQVDQKMLNFVNSNCVQQSRVDPTGVYSVEKNEGKGLDHTHEDL